MRTEDEHSGRCCAYSKVTAKESPPTVEKKEELKKHPDGGWGWFVVLAAFSVQFIILGLQNSSGVIFNQLVEKFNRPRGETGFVSSISCSMMFILGPLTASLCERFTCRKIAILGGLFCVAGMIASGYAGSLTHMCLSFGVTWGIGTSFCYFPTLIILVTYFDKHLALVNGIVASGSGIGTLTLSPFIQWFAQKYGVKDMFFMLAGLHVIVVICGFVYRPISSKYNERQYLNLEQKSVHEKEKFEEHSSRVNVDKSDYHHSSKAELFKHKNKSKNTFNTHAFKSLLSNKSFVAWSLGLSVFILGYFVPFVHLIRYAKLIGVSDVNAAFLISIISIIATICKVITGKIAGMDRVCKLRMYQSGLLIMTVATTFIPLAQTYTGLVIYAVVFGISESCFLVMIPLITKEIIEIRLLPLALGITFMSMGFTTVVAAPIAGWIFDAFHCYSYVFYVAGGLNACGILIMFFIDISKNKMVANGTNDVFIIEDKNELPSSKVIEFTCYASSERIFYSTLNINEPLARDHFDINVDQRSNITNWSNVDVRSTLARNHNKRLQIKDRPLSCALTRIPENVGRKEWGEENVDKSASCDQLEQFNDTKKSNRDKQLLLSVYNKDRNPYSLYINESSLGRTRVTLL